MNDPWPVCDRNMGLRYYEMSLYTESPTQAHAGIFGLTKQDKDIESPKCVPFIQ